MLESTTLKNEPICVFLSYSHEDSLWFHEEGRRLIPRLQREMDRLGARLWYDTGELKGGDPWRKKIETEIGSAHIAILLISLDFLLSDFVTNVEIPLIQERARTDPDFRVILIRVGHTGSLPIPFQDQFQHLPAAPQPLIDLLDNPGPFNQAQVQIHDAVRHQIEAARAAMRGRHDTIPAPETPVPESVENGQGTPPVELSLPIRDQEKPREASLPPEPRKAAESDRAPANAASSKGAAAEPAHTEPESPTSTTPVAASKATPVAASTLEAGVPRTIELAGGVPLELVWIPPGEFLMGSETDKTNKNPQHQVEITQGFWLAKYTVTKRQWQAMMGTAPWSGKDHVLDDPDSPAVCVNWEDAQAFCRKLGNSARLPTEAEWEYACRAGTTTAYCFGDDAARLGDYAWYCENAHDIGNEYAHKVGQKRANAWGLHDMHGNVWEWCQDWYGDYPSENVTNPTGPSSGSSRATRGSTTRYNPKFCRSARRSCETPARRVVNHGFRLALSPVR